MATSYTTRAASRATTPRVAQVAGKHDLVVVSALVSLGVVAYDLHKNSGNRQTAVKELGAVILLWALVFILAEFNDTLGSSVAVFLLVVFLVARRGAVTAILGNASVVTAPTGGAYQTAPQLH